MVVAMATIPDLSNAAREPLGGQDGIASHVSASGAEPEADPEIAALVGAPTLQHDSNFRRDRLLSAMVILSGFGLFLAAPFALKAGSTFFMPVTVAIVISLMLVPVLEWLERHRVPAALAALLSILLLFAIANAVLVMIVIPAADWVRMVPANAERIRNNIAPIVDAFHRLDTLSNQVATAVGQQAADASAKMQTEQPTSIVALVATTAPSVLIESFFALLLVFFFLSGWTEMREKIIRDRETLTGSLRVARLLRDMVSGTAQYLLTVAIINVALGAFVALIVWSLGMPTPLMWGGLAALFNFVPYVGPIIVVGLLGIGGMITFDEPFAALLPAGAFLCCHLTEANFITPKIVGKRLTMSPMAILLALSFWGWVWGTVGALVSVPLLILGHVLLERVGRPDVAGFLFDGRTLTRTSE